MITKRVVGCIVWFLLVSYLGIRATWSMFSLFTTRYESDYEIIEEVINIYCRYAMIMLLWIAGAAVVRFDEYFSDLWAPPLPRQELEEVDHKNTQTLFFAGLGGDLTQFARYTGTDGFNLPGVGQVYHRDAARLFPDPWTGVEARGNDAHPHGVSNAYWTGIFKQSWLTVAIHYYLRGFLTGIRGGPMVLHDFGEYNFGQEADVVRGLEMVRRAFKAHPAKKFILFGTSRGSVVALQVAARLSAEEIKKHVRFMILEGVFTSVPDVLTYRFGRGLGHFIEAVLGIFTRYDYRAPTPLSIAKTFPHTTLPIGVVTSAVDSVVDKDQCAKIHNVLKEKAGVETVRFLALNNSPHSDFGTGNVEDRKLYADFLESFYSDLIGLVKHNLISFKWPTVTMSETSLSNAMIHYLVVPSAGKSSYELAKEIASEIRSGTKERALIHLNSECVAYDSEKKSWTIAYEEKKVVEQ